MKRKSLLVLLVLLALTVLSTASAFAGELEDGNYYIKQGSKSINVYIDHLSEAKNYTKINMYATDDSNTQKFKLLQQDDGSYKILLAERTNLSLNVKALEKDTEVISYKDAKSFTEYYLIEETEKTGYYTIRMKNSPNLAITATGGKGLTLRKFTGAENQQFYFHAEGTVCPDLTAAAEPITEPENAVEDGNYYIKQGGKSLNIDIEHLSEAKNNTIINMLASDDSDWQKFKLLQQDDGSYKILLAAREKLALNVKALETDTAVVSYLDATSYTKYFLIEKTDRPGYYTIRMKDNPSLAITAAGENGLTLREFAGAENQQFYFHAEGTVCPDLSAVTETSPAEPETPAQTETVTEKKTYNIQLDVPKLSTQDKRWKNYKYSGSAKIGKYGCLLVSCTAALSYMDDEVYRPDTLSKKFKFSDGSMQWTSKWGKSRFKSGVKYSLTTIRKQLEAGKPVLIHGYSKKNGHHWAVITGVKGDGTKRSHYTVMDPSFSKVKTLDQFLKNFPDKKKLVTIKK